VEAWPQDDATDSYKNSPKCGFWKTLVLQNTRRGASLPGKKKGLVTASRPPWCVGRDHNKKVARATVLRSKGICECGSWALSAALENIPHGDDEDGGDCGYGTVWQIAWTKSWRIARSFWRTKEHERQNDQKTNG
jgi:hypothetical protein